MTPIFDNWVLIADGNCYTIARYFGEQTDSKGRVRRDLRNVKYYTSLVAAFNGLRGQLEHEILSEGFPSLCEAFLAVIESNAKVAEAYNRIADILEGKA